jgi:hypothetical protein
MRLDSIWRIERKQHKAPRWIEADEIGGAGLAIVREITVCPACHALLTAADGQARLQGRTDRPAPSISLVGEARGNRAMKRPRKRPKGLRSHPMLLPVAVETARSA